MPVTGHTPLLPPGGWRLDGAGCVVSPLFFLAVFSLQLNATRPALASLFIIARARRWHTHSFSLSLAHTARTPPLLCLFLPHPLCPALPSIYTLRHTHTSPALLSLLVCPTCTAPPSGSPLIHNHTPRLVRPLAESRLLQPGPGTCLLVRCLPRRCPPTDASPKPRRWPVTTSCRGGPPAERERERCTGPPIFVRASFIVARHRRPCPSSGFVLLLRSRCPPHLHMTLASCPGPS
jgi:hypothetical protein